MGAVMWTPVDILLMAFTDAAGMGVSTVSSGDSGNVLDNGSGEPQCGHGQGAVAEMRI